MVRGPVDVAAEVLPPPVDDGLRLRRCSADSHHTAAVASSIPRGGWLHSRGMDRSSLPPSSVATKKSTVPPLTLRRRRPCVAAATAWPCPAATSGRIGDIGAELFLRSVRRLVGALIRNRHADRPVFDFPAGAVIRSIQRRPACDGSAPSHHLHYWRSDAVVLTCGNPAASHRNGCHQFPTLTTRRRD